ncbi:DUF5305 family protein [Saccharolobus solfataricus]
MKHHCNTINKIVYFTVKSKDFNYLPFLVLVGGLSAFGLYLFFGTEVKKVDVRLESFRKFTRKYNKVVVFVKDLPEDNGNNVIQVKESRELVKIASISGVPILVNDTKMKAAVVIQNQIYAYSF